MRYEREMGEMNERQTDRHMTHWKQLCSQGVQLTKLLRGFCDSATHSSSTICNDSVGPWSVVARASWRKKENKRRHK